MADYNNYKNGTKGRFGSLFKSWDAPQGARSDPWASDLFSRPNTPRDHVCRPVIFGSDGKAMPVVLDSLARGAQHVKMTTIDESDYRVQPASPYKREYTPGERKMGLGGMFQRAKPESTLTSEGGWTRPSPYGWKLPPEEPLGTVANNIETAVEYSRGPAKPGPVTEWARLGPVQGRLGKTTNDINEAADYLRGSALTTRTGRWGPSGLQSAYGGRKVGGSIDSREAVKSYGGQYI